MMTRFTGLAFAALFLSGVTSATAAAYEPPAGTVEYAIHHSKYKQIGTHRLTFSRSGEDLIVDVAVRIKIKLLFITVHSLTADRREVWREGRLVGYTSHTDENNELIDVSAQSDGAKLVIKGPVGKAETNAAVFPTNPWNPGIVKTNLLMDTKTGKLLKVSVATAGEEAMDVAGKSVPASKFTISGDMERELWFDSSGNCIQFRFVSDGATVTFSRITPMP